MKIERKCKFCGKKCKTGTHSKGLCHKDDMWFRRREKYKLKANKMLEKITKLEEIVLGKKKIELDISGTHYQ